MGLNGTLTPLTNDLTTGDVWHALTKATVGAVPVLGPAVSELFQLAITTPAQLRQAQWQASVTEVLKQLIINVDGLSVESLSKNEDFLTAVIATTQIAMKTSRIEKINMLQAVIYRSGSGIELNDFVRNTFLQIVDRYVPDHVVVLRALTKDSAMKQAFEKLKISQPDKVSTSSNEPGAGEHCKIEDLVTCLVDDLDGSFAVELFSDLHRDDLCQGSEGFALSYYKNHLPYIVTDRGKEFLKFVTFER